MTISEYNLSKDMLKDQPTQSQNFFNQTQICDRP